MIQHNSRGFLDWLLNPLPPQPGPPQVGWRLWAQRVLLLSLGGVGLVWLVYLSLIAER